MNSLNKIDPQHIERLNADQLVRLLDLLLHAEAKDRCLSKHGIHVPFQITVPDGGRDAVWNAEIEPYEYIPKRLTYYQSKAQSLTDAQCRAEILRTDKDANCTLKEKVHDVLENKGAYVIFCGYPIVKIDEKVAACRKALLDAGRGTPENDCIEFLDANKIAHWVNKHVSAFAYVCQVTSNFQEVAMKTIHGWGQENIFRYDFQSNEYLTDQIRNLREYLLKPQNVARITGPSGLGKTRLGYEVFSHTAGSNDQASKVLYESAVYIDAQYCGQSVLGWVDQLYVFDYAGIVIVDNCPHDWHYKLASIVQRENSKLSLLTLDYVPEPIRQGILHVPLDPFKLRDVVPKILKNVPDLSHLEEAEIQRISTFAQGFPQIAILTAKAGQALNIQDLNYQNKLADKLLWGRDQPDDKAREIVRCLSLFSFVGVAGNVKKQLDFIRAHLCGNIDEFEFNRRTRRFKDMRIIQEAGNFIMVAPPPLAVALAAEWLADAPDEYILALLPGIAENDLTRPFCDQLHKLDFSDRATELSKRLMGPDSPLSLAEVLNSEVGSQIFRALAELNPPAAVECLTRIYSHYSPAQAREITDGRRNLIWALEKLCWSVDTFCPSAMILLNLASGENESIGNNATQQFKQLFHIYLSGTRCPAVKRLDVIRLGLQSQYVETRRVCVVALGASLEHGHFSRMSGPEVRGTQMPERDWEPAKYEDIWSYWRDVFYLLREEILKNNAHSNLAFEVLGNGIGALLGNSLVIELEGPFKDIAEARGGYWPNARQRIYNFLTFNKEIPDDAREAIQRWLTYVKPKNLNERLLDVVSNPAWRHEQKSDGEFVDVAASQAEALADEFYANNVDWTQYIVTLVSGEQRQAFVFGAKCATLCEDVRDLIEVCLNALRPLDKDKQNPQLLRGVLCAIKDKSLVSSTLDVVANDGSLVNILVPLTTAIGPELEDFDRVLGAIHKGLLAPYAIRLFAYGSVTAKFDDASFKHRLCTLVESKPEVSAILLDLISMHCYRNPEKLICFDDLLERLLISPDLFKSRGGDTLAHNWKTHVKNLLGRNPTAEWIRKLSAALVENFASLTLESWLRFNTTDVMTTLLGKHYAIAWPIFSDALKDTEKRDAYLVVILLTDGGTSFQEHGSPLWELPTATLKPWLEDNTNLIPHILHFMSLYVVEKGTDGSERYSWHPHALLMIQTGNIDDIIGCVHANLASFGSSGSRVPYLEKRIALINSLPADNPNFRKLSQVVGGYLRQSLDMETRRDAQFAAGIF